MNRVVYEWHWKHRNSLSCDWVLVPSSGSLLAASAPLNIPPLPLSISCALVETAACCFPARWGRGGVQLASEQSQVFFFLFFVFFSLGHRKEYKVIKWASSGIMRFWTERFDEGEADLADREVFNLTHHLVAQRRRQPNNSSVGNKPGKDINTPRHAFLPARSLKDTPTNTASLIFNTEQTRGGGWRG